MKAGIAVFTALLCSTTFAQTPDYQGLADKVHARLQALSSIREAIAVFGYPTSERQIAGDHVYEWLRSSEFMDPGALAPTVTHCTIEIGADENGVIKNTNMEGNVGECARFASNLR